MNTSLKIIFFGTEDFSLAALRHLIDAGFDIAAVVTKPDSKKGRGHKTTPPAVKVLAEANNIPVWQPNKLAEIYDNILALQPVAGVLVSYGKIIPASIIDLFTPGIINLHPSLLPKYRGPSPIESAILNGDDKTGVSIMQLSPAMDAGAVYAQKIYLLNGSETKPQLYATLAEAGSELLVEILPNILNGKLQPEPQNDAAATYCQLLQKTDSQLDPSNTSAQQAERQVRAYLGFPKTKLQLDEHNLIITKAHISSQQKTPLDIEFRGGEFLSIDELVGPSGKTMSAEAFIRGYLS